jgi:hypothetical protein
MADGLCSSRGEVGPPPDILALIVGEHERPAAEATANRRRETAIAMLGAAVDVVHKGLARLSQGTDNGRGFCG